MNDDIRDIIISVTKSPPVLACLQLAELVDTDDYTNFSQSSINILERYIQSRTSTMDLASRKLYLPEEFLYYPDKFVFTPGIRNRLLKAAKRISGNVFVSQHCDSNKSDTTESHQNHSTSNYDHFASFNHQNNISTEEPANGALDFCKPDNQFLSSPPTCPALIKTEVFDRGRHMNYLDKYYSDISKNASKNFDDCFLVPKVDFQITIPDDDPTNLIGLYHCNLCFDRRKTPTTIKFRFSKYNSVLYTNINSHLKIHFKYIIDTPERKRVKLNKSIALDGAVFNQNSNGVSVGKLEFES